LDSGQKPTPFKHWDRLDEGNNWTTEYHNAFMGYFEDNYAPKPDHPVPNTEDEEHINVDTPSTRPFSQPIRVPSRFEDFEDIQPEIISSHAETFNLARQQAIQYAENYLTSATQRTNII
jgi:hypothetical protein